MIEHKITAVLGVLQPDPALFSPNVISLLRLFQMTMVQRFTYISLIIRP